MPKKNPLHDFLVFIRYAIVGSIGTGVDVGVLYLLVEYLDIPVLVATVFSFIAAVINNFVLNKYWTFQNKHTNIRKQFIKFFLVAGIGLVLTLGFMFIFVHVLVIPNLPLFSKTIPGYVIAKMITSVIVLVWNFLGNKFWTFNDKIRTIQHLEHHEYDISIVIPAYNEEKRIINTVQSIDRFFAAKPWKREIIVVDDGSADRTAQVVEHLRSTIPKLKLIRYETNQGKGYAVKTGVEQTRGSYVLFTDADNSTPIEEFERIFPLLKEYEVVIGSRYIRGSDIQIEQPRYRVMMGRLGNFIIQAFLLDGIKDTQCGFKAFQHGAALEIFSRVKVKRFGFDMEILAIARLLKYRIKEVPVSWFNSRDSRVRPIKDGIRTLKELILIKLNLWGGRYH